MQEVWEKNRKKGIIIIIIINKKLTGKINMNKKEENKHNIKSKIKHIIMWGLVMLVHARGEGLANEMESCSSYERVQAGVRHQGRGYHVPVALGPDEER